MDNVSPLFCYVAAFSRYFLPCIRALLTGVTRCLLLVCDVVPFFPQLI